MVEKDAATVSRQQQVGAMARQETRRRLLIAAGEEFEAGGYQAATVSRIAERAGVTVQTLYLAWGNKRSLLRAYLESRLSGGGQGPDAVVKRFVGKSPREVVDELAALVGEIADRAAIGWKLYRDASVVDPEIAADWDELQSLRRRTIDKALRNIPTGALRAGMARRDAVDTAWAIVSPECYELLVTRRGYTLDQFQNWMRQTLRAALLR